MTESNYAASQASAAAAAKEREKEKDESPPAPIAQVTPENPYGNLPGDPKGFKRIEVKTASDMMKEQEEKEKKDAEEKEKASKKTSAAPK